MPKIIDPKRSGAKATCERREPKSFTKHIYGLTVRHNPKYKTGGELYSASEKKVLYDRLIGWMEAKGLKIDNVYYEEKNGLHFHARAIYKKKLYFKAWKKQPFHILFKEMYDSEGWEKYCAKEQLQKDLQVYMNEYAFNDQSSDESNL